MSVAERLKKKRKISLHLQLCLHIAFFCILSPTAQGAFDRRSYEKPFAIAALALNLPYTIQFVCNKNECLKDRLFYKGDTQAALWNHSLSLINFAALNSELPGKALFLTGAVLVGLQTTTYVLCESYGVSLVWSGLTGMLLHRLWIQKVVKWHLVVAMLFSSATLAYYAYKAPAITTIAHLGGVAAGLGFSFLLPYKKSALAK